MMTFTPILNTVYASNTDPSVEQLKNMSSQEIEKVADSVEENFHEKYGYLDEFKVTSENEKTKIEVNGSIGVIRITSYDSGEVIKTENIDFLDNLEQVKEEEINSLSSRRTKRSATVLKKTVTNGPDPFSLKVETNGNYKSDFKLVAVGWYDIEREYYKNDSWNTGRTEDFYNSILSAQNSMKTIEKSTKNAAAYFSVKAILKKYTGPKALVPEYELQLILDAAGLSWSAGALAGGCISYLTNLGYCQHYFNLL